MIKSALLATAICFAFVVPASAQQTVKCDEASLTKMRADIDALTDADKKAKSLESWTAAEAAFKPAKKMKSSSSMSVAKALA